VETNVEIQVGSNLAVFTLDFIKWHWVSTQTLPEGDFPLVTCVGGKRYELYSDGTFAEVET
jgi:hypothetical protein